METKIRLGTLEEALKIDSQIKEFERGYIQNKLKTKVSEKDLIILIASVGSEDVGFSISYDEFKDGSLYAWVGAVLSEWRGKGVYSELAKEREKYAKQKGYSSLKLKTQNKRREMLCYLIEKGWNIIDFFPKDDVGESRILFEKKII